MISTGGHVIAPGGPRDFHGGPTSFPLGAHPLVSFLSLGFLDLHDLSPGTAEEAKSLAEDLLICLFAEHLHHEWLLQLVK